jgi:hypothetical protein
VLANTHDFFSRHESLRLRALRAGARLRRIRLYENASTASVDEIVAAVRRAVTPTRRATSGWGRASSAPSLRCDLTTPGR